MIEIKTKSLRSEVPISYPDFVLSSHVFNGEPLGLSGL